MAWPSSENLRPLAMRTSTISPNPPEPLLSRYPIRLGAPVTKSNTQVPQGSSAGCMNWGPGASRRRTAGPMESLRPWEAPHEGRAPRVKA